MQASQDNRQLLCTFTNDKDFLNTATDIKKFYEIYNYRIFAFQNSNNTKEVYLTYNVLNMHKGGSKFPNTILIHRKKQSNTLYSLNALNTLITEECGSLDKTFVIDWSLYSNSLVIAGGVSVKIVPLKILQILD